MKHGDFTQLAKKYINRPAYSSGIIMGLLKQMGYQDKTDDIEIADVGAGTGKLTKVILELGLNVLYAVEPNDNMREEGIDYLKNFDTEWVNGTGESTGLPDNQFDWVTMASSFHWTNPEFSLPEFARILKTNGYFTAIWNPRNIESSPLHQKIENVIYDLAPHITRVSSGINNVKKWEEILVSTGDFKDVIFLETDHSEVMSIERYMNVWRSVNDIRHQAGEEKFDEILKAIEGELQGMNEITVPYKMRAWTAQKV